MNRMFLLTSALALAIVVSSNVIGADDKDKTPSVKEVMEALHGEDGLRRCVTRLGQRHHDGTVGRVTLGRVDVAVAVRVREDSARVKQHD